MFTPRFGKPPQEPEMAVPFQPAKRGGNAILRLKYNIGKKCVNHTALPRQPEFGGESIMDSGNDPQRILSLFAHENASLTGFYYTVPERPM